jgi:hypothetical protein|tara:strand:- start:3627 stop:3833 length:207 start_codon:yes stop_codon:yes gene_type:complete
MPPEILPALVPFALHRHRCGRVFWVESRKGDTIWLFYDQTPGPTQWQAVNCCPCETLFNHEDFEVISE